MKKLNVVILYKDKSYQIISIKKLNTSKLMEDNIKLILIPLYDNPNAYIPIKPSNLYNFKKVTVSIIYQAFIYDMEDQLGTSFSTQEYYKECNNIIDFINAIYNCYKFRGVSIYLSEYSILSTYRTMTFVMSIRRIHLKFFNNANQLIDEIDSGIMKDLQEYKPKKFYKIPPAYTNEDRLDCLREILYIPNSYDHNYTSDIDKLPICMQLEDNNIWKKVKKPGSLLPTDYILYKIPDFEIYYMMQYELYIKLLNFKEFEIHYVSTPIAEKYDEDFLTSLDKNKIPSFSEKEAAIEAYLSGDLFSITNTCADINSIDNFLQSLIFFRTIMSYIKYFGIYCYAEESPVIKMRNFVIFGRGLGCYGCNEFQGEILLSDLELSYDKILESFLIMIMKGLN